jgi:hypothetical protein
MNTDPQENKFGGIRKLVYLCKNKTTMATVTKYDVLSPDGFSISFDEMWDTPDEASKALDKWVERYRGQGYYSTTNRERIPLDELTTWCTIVPIETEE